MSVRATSRVTGIHKTTILGLLETVGAKCASLFDAKIRNLKARRVQCDEIWSFLGAKQKNVPEEKLSVWGDWWTWTAIDADTKLIISFLVGSRGPSNCYDFMKRRGLALGLTGAAHHGRADVVHRRRGSCVRHRCRLRDDHEALREGRGGRCERGARYSPAKIISTTTDIVTGDPDARHISTSYVERQNLTMRMQMRRFTRLTNGFSKSMENHAAMVNVYFMHYNFCRVHQTLSVTPAMEAGLTDHVWTMGELLAAQ